MTDNEKYAKSCQALIIGGDPQKREEEAANRNKAGAPFQYAESLFASLMVVKSMTGCCCTGACRGWKMQDPSNSVTRQLG